MFIPSQPQFYEGPLGYYPVIWSGTDAIVPADHPWKFATMGSIYILRTTGEFYKKVADNHDSSDWVSGISSSGNIKDAPDFTDTTGPATDGYSLVWDDTVGKFVLSEITGGGGGVTDHGALTGLADDDHSQYILSTGARTGASAQAQTFTNGLVAPSWKPESDSTTALQIQNAAGTDNVLTIDTTNERLGIGVTPPTTTIEALSSSGNAMLRMRTLSTDSGDSAGFQFVADVVTATALAYTAATGGGARFNFVSSDGYLLLGTTTEHIIAFNTSNARRMTLSALGYLGIGLTGPTALLDLAASSTTRASLRIRNGVAPTNPQSGDVWSDGTDLFVRLGSTTYTLNKTAV